MEKIIAINPDLKIVVWSILLGILSTCILFLIWSRRTNKGEERSKFKLILIVVFIAAVFVVGYYFLLVSKSQGAIVKFPSTGIGPMYNGHSMYLKSLYTTKIDGLITSSLCILTALLILIVFRNIARGKKIDQAKSEFVSLASHQLRTPLTAISWHTEMILNGDAGPVLPRQKKYLEKIYQATERMIELVNTLLDVSRIDLGTFKAELKPTDILLLAESVIDEQRPKIKKKKLIFVQKFSNDIEIFLTDSKLLRMIFQNLLTNAIKYTPSGGTIKFSISLDEQEAIFIKVTDTGYGIPKNQQDKIFTKFFQADNTKDEVTGTGLGLYIVKSIVLSAGGEIWFESEENLGTTFYIIFPMEKVKRKAVSAGKYNLLVNTTLNT